MSTVADGLTVRTPTWMVWAGRLMSAAPVLIVLSSARWKLTQNPWYVTQWQHIGWQVPALPLIASLQLIAITLYLIPQTAVLGAVLLTGYLGGAIASYGRIGEWYPPVVPFTTAVLAWGGLWLRDARLRELLPWRFLRGGRL
jgi:hypothetical protein